MSTAQERTAMHVTLEADEGEKVLCTTEALPDGTMFAVWDIPATNGAALVRSKPTKSLYLREWRLVYMGRADDVFKRFHKDLTRAMATPEIEETLNAANNWTNQTDPGAPNWEGSTSAAVLANVPGDVSEDEAPF
jgi:hypothetical protein